MKKATYDEHSQLLTSLEVHWAESLARSLSDEELKVEAAREAQRCLDSEVKKLDQQASDVILKVLMM